MRPCQLLILRVPQSRDRLVQQFEDEAPACWQTFPGHAPRQWEDPIGEAEAWARSCGQELGGDKRLDGLSGRRIRSLCSPKLDCPQPLTAPNPYTNFLDEPHFSGPGWLGTIPAGALRKLL
jgi:hypothetical protein